MNSPEQQPTPAITYPIPHGAILGTTLPYSLATQVGDLIFVSGQASVDETGAIVGGTFEEEFRRAMGNLQRVLETANSDLAHVAQVRSYVRDPANVALYNQLYREYFSEPLPARTTLTNCLPDVLHFEIECIAVARTEKSPS